MTTDPMATEQLNKATSIIAGIRIIVPAICSILGVYGIQADAEMWMNIAIILFGGLFSIFAGWKNNDVTLAAQVATNLMRQLKKGENAEVVEGESNGEDLPAHADEVSGAGE